MRAFKNNNNNKINNVNGKKNIKKNKGFFNG